MQDVEAVYTGEERRFFLVKSISVLSSDEREMLRLIYLLEGEWMPETTPGSFGKKLE